MTKKSRFTKIASLLPALLIVFVAIAALPQTPAPSLAAPTDLQGRGASAPTDAGPLLFLPSVTYPAGGAAWSVALGDLNHDGKLDAVVIDISESVAVLLGNGDGSFQPPVLNPCAAWAVAIADVNGDNKPDLLVGAAMYAGVLLGNGDGTFQPVVFYSAGISGGSNGATSLAVADVNGDSKPDLVLAGGYAAAAAVLLGNGDGTFRPGGTYPTADYYDHSVTVADVNGDGKPDVLTVGWDLHYSGQLGVLIGRGDGTFKTVVTYSTGPGEGLSFSAAAADVNGDGKSDVLVSSNGIYEVGVMLGNGDGTFQPVVGYDSGGSHPATVAVADVNADAKPDILVSNWDSGTVGVLLGNGNGTFQSTVSYDSDQFAPSLAVGDLNGDGKPDMVVTDEIPTGTSGLVTVLLNNSGATPTSTALAPSVNPVTIGQVVTYTATVASQSGGALTGTVTFKDGSTAIATVSLANNQAAFSTKYKTPKMLGPHSITCRYSGVLHQAAGSQSATLIETVRAPSITALTSSGSPSMAGQPVTFTANVKSHYGTIPDGELVIFYDGPKALASVTLAGQKAVFTTSTLSVKTHIIKATYVGDNKFAASSKKVIQVVQ